MNKIFIILFIYLIALVSKANAIIYDDIIKMYIDKANNITLYNNARWRNLFHNKNIKDNNFWLSSNNDLKEELKYSIIAMFNKNNLNDTHFLCKFPARTKFIMDMLNISDKELPKPYCKDFQNYIDNVIYDNIYISYASENIISPMSMMGHIFIKIDGYNKQKDINVNNAVSYYANYNKDTEWIWSFYYKSLFYYSNGIYNILPYRQKLIEYNDLGKRNIQDYKLNLTQEEKEYIILHIWELKDINAPYNFIIHNCGVATIRILAVANDNFNYAIIKPWATPLDVLKRIYAKNLINGIDIFPSEQYKIQMFKNNFSYAENKIIDNFIKNEDVSELLKNDRKNDLLFMTDIVSGHLVINQDITEEKYKNIQKIIADNFDGMESVMLKNITKIQLNSPFSSAIQLNYEKYKSNDGMSINLYPVYRTLNDNNNEYFNEFALNLLNIDLFVDFDNSETILKSLDLINVKSILPVSYFINSLSFNINLGYKDGFYETDNRGNFYGELGIGKAYTFIDLITPYIMINGLFFKKPYLKIETGTIFKYQNAKIIANYNYFLAQNKKIESIINIDFNLYINDRFAINFAYKYYNFYKDINSYNNVLGGIKYYF